MLLTLVARIRHTLKAEGGGFQTGKSQSCSRIASLLPCSGCRLREAPYLMRIETKTEQGLFTLFSLPLVYLKTPVIKVKS